MCTFSVPGKVIPVSPEHAPVHNWDNRNKLFYFDALGPTVGGEHF
jgi:hypothetical protein